MIIMKKSDGLQVIEEGLCFPADEVVFLMGMRRGQRRFGDGIGAMEMGISACFCLGGRVLMVKSIDIFTLAHVEVEH